MRYPNPKKWTVLASLACLTAACSPAATDPASSGAALSAAVSAPARRGAAMHKLIIDAGAFCAKLQPALQPLTNLSLVLFKADDSTTDAMHAGESEYVACDFRQQNTQINVSLYGDSDGLFDDPHGKDYAPLPGVRR